MKKRISGFISLIVLIFAFGVIRVPLFQLHGMKQWPFVLFIFASIIITVFGILFCCRILSVFTAAGYILGFVIGYLFQFDYGIGLNSMWIIWTCCYIVFILFGTGWTMIDRNRR